MFSVLTVVLAILSSWHLVWVSFRRLKNKPVLRNLRFQVLATGGWNSAKKYMWQDR